MTVSSAVTTNFKYKVYYRILREKLIRDLLPTKDILTNINGKKRSFAKII